MMRLPYLRYALSIPVLLATFLPLALSACATRLREIPMVVLHYYPYTVSMVRTVAAPTPDYDDWSEERMARDLQRLTDLGINIVMVSMNPEEVADAARAQRYLRFVELAQSTPLQVALMCEAHAASAEQLALFAGWCRRTLPGREGYFHLHGEPLVVFYDALAGEDLRPEGIASRHTVWAEEWYWGTHWSDQPPLSANGEQAMAFAGFLNDGDRPEQGWEAERENGERLRRQFRGAVASGARFICVASYNDFWEGHFIEPNTLDGTSLYEVLRSEIDGLGR